MKVGFTGTRNGMTAAQAAAFGAVISELPSFAEFHHGDCVGADDEAANAVHEMRLEEGGHRLAIVCHPPLDEKLRAFNPCHDAIRAPKTHFARNRDIVDESDVLIATPAQMTHQPRGGTWYTVDYARKKGRLVILVLTDGTVERDVH